MTTGAAHDARGRCGLDWHGLPWAVYVVPAMDAPSPTNGVAKIKLTRSGKELTFVCAADSYRTMFTVIVRPGECLVGEYWHLNRRRVDVTEVRACVSDHPMIQNHPNSA